MLNDPLANALSGILNNERISRRSYEIKPASKVIKRVLEVIKEAHYIGDYKEIDDGKGGIVKVNLIGAVNTVVNKDGVLKGYNTDMDGFLEPFKKKKLNIANTKVLLLGAGGAARAIVAGFAKEKANSITIANRTLENANNLSEFAKKIGLSANAIKIEDVNDSVKDYDIIVNATSVGLKNESSLISLEGINEKIIVYDIVYMPMNTNFIKKAKEKKAIVIFGYEMLLGQAARSFEIWHGMEAPYNAMKKALLGGF